MIKSIKTRRNLQRLLAPRHIAFIGGSDAETSARQCAKVFPGPVWGVNPKRKLMAGLPCFSSVSELPEPPDAVFMATPRQVTLSILKALNDLGAGGAVLFTAGYGELGEEGRQAQQEMVEAAGDLALVGPNCYGLISYVNKAIMWPFGAGACECDQGVALIMQSGMMTANMALNQRSVPIVYVISAGNQAMLAIEDYIDIFVDDPAVTAMGIYMEGIADIENFANAALRALQAGKPIVLIKGGSSAIGSQLTISHTGSLSGSDDAHQALFDQLAIMRVDSPELMLETLKFMTVSGVPKGKRVAAFTCSGGDAALVADYSEKKTLVLPQPSTKAFSRLEKLLPDIATVSNPLDYTTPLWGNAEIMPKVFTALLEDGFDAAIFIQDYPPKELADNALYLIDGKSYMDAANALQIPAAICSELSENLNKDAREFMIDNGVSPLQGIDRGLDAIAIACDYNDRRNFIMRNFNNASFKLIDQAIGHDIENSSIVQILNEWQSKQRLQAAGVAISKSKIVAMSDIDQAAKYADEIGFPVVVKLVVDNLVHKSELGLVRVNLRNAEQVNRACEQLQLNFNQLTGLDNDVSIQGVLIESMVEDVIQELLIGVKQDAQFGLVMVVASGGIMVEIIRDANTLILPTTTQAIKQSLSTLRCYPLLMGFRGNAGCDIDKLAEQILKIARFAQDNAHILLEMDINPLMVLADDFIAADAFIKLRVPR